MPWIVTFSFGRALQQPALGAWKGNEARVEDAQALLYQQTKSAAAARLGKFEQEQEMERGK